MGPDPKKSFDLPFLIQKDTHLRGIFFHKFLQGLSAFFTVDAKKDKIFILHLAVQFFQERSLLPASGSPCGPEIQKENFPQVFLNHYFFPL